MSKKEKKTNLIWIMADQLRADMLGCNKDPNAYSKHRCIGGGGSKLLPCGEYLYAVLPGAGNNAYRDLS